MGSNNWGMGHFYRIFADNRFPRTKLVKLGSVVVIGPPLPQLLRYREYKFLGFGSFRRGIYKQFPTHRGGFILPHFSRCFIAPHPVYKVVAQNYAPHVWTLVQNFALHVWTLVHNFALHVWTVVQNFALHVWTLVQNYAPIFIVGA